MNLNDTLTEIAAFLSLDANALIAFADEDTLGGFNFDAALSKFPMGSLWDVEGRIIYALVRALKPAQALELGTWHGASTTHLLTALEQNQRGKLRSVDYWEGAGDLVPDGLRQRWKMQYAEAVHYLSSKLVGAGKFDFVFEDCIHSESEVYAIVTALKPKLRAGAVVVHHDSEHGDDGAQIRRALDRAGVNYRSWLISPSDCGLAIYRYDG